MKGSNHATNGISKRGTNDTHATEEALMKERADGRAAMAADAQREAAVAAAARDVDRESARSAWLAKRDSMRFRSFDEASSDSRALDSADYSRNYYERSTMGELAVIIFGQNYDGDIVKCALDDVADELSILGGFVGNDEDGLGNRLWRASERCRVALELERRAGGNAAEVKLRAQLAETERKLAYVETELARTREALSKHPVPVAPKSATRIKVTRASAARTATAR